jgi:hypothetical protein
MDQSDLVIHQPCCHYSWRLPDSLHGGENLMTGWMTPPAASNRLACNALCQ